MYSMPTMIARFLKNWIIWSCAASGSTLQKAWKASVVGMIKRKSTAAAKRALQPMTSISPPPCFKRHSISAAYLAWDGGHPPAPLSRVWPSRARGFYPHDPRLRTRPSCLRRGSTATAGGSALAGGDRLTDHRILVASNVGAAGCAEIEDDRGIGRRPRFREVASNETPDVLRERNAELRRAASSGLLAIPARG